MLFAKIAGTQVLYSGSMEEVARLLANYDKTFSRPYLVSPLAVTVPHTTKPIKGSRAATQEEAKIIEALVEQRRALNQLSSMKREDPPSRTCKVRGYQGTLVVVAPAPVRRKESARFVLGLTGLVVSFIYLK